jgi:hypothetical protein
MRKQENVARLIGQIRTRDFDIGHFCVINETEVFFPSFRLAKSYAKNLDKVVVRVDGQISGWLVKDPPKGRTHTRP